MKKVLIITNFYHSSPRIVGLFKYLPEFGWDPFVLTIPSDKVFRINIGNASEFRKNKKIIETNYKGDIFHFLIKMSKLFGLKTEKSILSQVKEKLGVTSKKSWIDYLIFSYNTLIGYPDEVKNWKKPALKKTEELLKKKKFCAIISSSPPVTSHIVAAEIRKRHKIPWLADFRDLWTQNHNYSYPWWRKLFEEKLEKKTLFPANALSTLSWHMAEKLESLHKKENIAAIINGFDPEMVNDSPIKLTSKFTITYTGQIYPAIQDSSKILIALRDLILDGIMNPKDIELRFYGPERFWLEKEIEKYGLSDIVKQHGAVSREVCLKKQWESHVLLVLNVDNPKIKYGYFGKTFEYLAAKRPILSSGGFGSDVLEDLLEETKAGVYALTAEDVKKFLKRFYLEYKKKGKVIYNGKWAEIKKYNHREMAKKFADILDSINTK